MFNRQDAWYTMQGVHSGVVNAYETGIGSEALRGRLFAEGLRRVGAAWKHYATGN